MGWGSSGTPPWVDDKRIDEEKKDDQNLRDLTNIQALEKENEALNKNLEKHRRTIEKIFKKRHYFRRRGFLEFFAHHVGVFAI